MEINHSAAPAIRLPANSFRRRSAPDVPQDVDFLMEHLNDPNFDYQATPSHVASSIHIDHHTKTTFSDYDVDSSRDSIFTSLQLDDESPYPEVRAAVSSVDDSSMHVNTFRMWFIGIIFSVLFSALNQVFTMRYPSIQLASVIAQLTSLPLGIAMAQILPTTRFNVLGYKWSFNPGPFNIKEHVLISVMTNVVVNGSYANFVLAAQQIFYHQSLTFAYQFFLALSTQLIGFSLGGLLRQFIVWPSNMIWPGALVNCALFNTLHNSYLSTDGHHISRHKFFCFVLAGSFFWYWMPGYLWTALSMFNWVCWIRPENVPVNALFGTATGLGMGVFTFDWAMISYQGSPLVAPWWCEANIITAFVVCFWIVTPIIYFTDTWFTAHLPISSALTFDNTGLPYNTSLVVANGEFNITQYQAYSPVFMTATMAVAYGIAFASFSAVTVHTLLWYRRDIARCFKRSLKDERDIHSRLMQAYPEVPQWWYVLLGLAMFILLFIAVEIFPTQLPIWGVCVAFAFAAIFSIPIGILQAITNQQVGLNVVFEMIGSCLFPGKPVAVMIFKAISYNSTNRAIGFAADLKIGHYMKVPPRLMFNVQIVATAIGALVSLLVQNTILSNVVDVCQPDQPQFFSCPVINTFASASLIWGSIGPQRLFSSGGMYNALLWFFAIGAVLPVPFYFLARRYPLSYWRYINIPILFAGVSALPPASGINFSSWGVVAFVFQWFVRRYHFRWWIRYNYILSAGLDAGLALCLIVIFFVLQVPKGGITLNWWGNNVWMQTADASGAPLYAMPPGQTFGPSTWA